MKFVNVGFGNIVNKDRVLSVAKYEANPIKRLVINAKKNNTLYDCTNGRKTKVVLIMDNGNIVLSANQIQTITNRFNLNEEILAED